MKIIIMGLGYVGCTAAACIASEGHEVVGIDPSGTKVDTINEGKAPISEPKLAELIAEAHANGRLSASTSLDDALDGADIAIVCVGTPSAPDGSHNMTYIAEASRQIASALATAPAGGKRLTVSYRSTVRPGTMDELVEPIFRAVLGEALPERVELVYNPEFLRESSAVDDYFSPPKIVVGTVDGRPSANMDNLHANLSAKTFTVPMREAEFTKFVDNSWHAAKVAFANEVGRLCTRQGISARTIHEIFVHDTKLNVSAYYMRPGGAFGGSCLPKDVRAIQYISNDVGAHTHLVDALLKSNEAHKHFIYEQVVAGLPAGAAVLLVGLAFKAHTDDLRESPNIDLARKLLAAGFALSVYDPALDASKLVGQNLGYAFSQLPQLRKLMVDRDAAESGGYARIVVANASAKGLDLRGDIIDIGAIA